MRINFKVLVAAIGVLGLSVQAQALTISPSSPACDADPVCLLASGPETANGDILDILEGLVGDTDSAYKDNVGGSESGTYADNYVTTYFNEPLDPSDALIEWTGGAFIDQSPVYLIVKDGQGPPGFYIFMLTGWDGMEDLELEDFWPNQGAISHVEIRTGESSRVPDGGSTTMLFGMGLLGLAALRRRFGRI
jgi:hypothetical protein